METEQQDLRYSRLFVDNAPTTDEISEFRLILGELTDQDITDQDATLQSKWNVG